MRSAQARLFPKVPHRVTFPVSGIPECNTMLRVEDPSYLWGC